MGICSSKTSTDASQPNQPPPPTRVSQQTQNTGLAQGKKGSSPPQDPGVTPVPAKLVHRDESIPAPNPPQSDRKPSRKPKREPKRKPPKKPPPRSSRPNFPPVSQGISRTTAALPFDSARRGDWPISEGETSQKPLPESGSSNPSSHSRPMSGSASIDTHHNASHNPPRAPSSSSARGGHVGTDLDSRADARANPKRVVTFGNNTRPFLLPTVREVLPDGFRFRILVLGKRQSGKSSLINAVFNVDMSASPGSQHGNADINASFSPDDNRYLLAHEYSGFEPGDAQSLQTIRDFISNHTDAKRPVSERLHAIWICVPISDAIERGLGEGVKTVLSLNKVPVLIVFTKFDQLVYRVQFDNTHGDIQGNDDPGARAYAMYGDLCRSLFDREPKDSPAVIFSEKQGYSDLMDGLTSTTHELIKGALDNSTDRPTSPQGPLPVPLIPTLLGWSIAQRVNHHITIQASIEVGRYQYWSSLGSSQDFTGQTLESCLNVIREDITNVWNFEDKKRYLSSSDFTARMTRLVGDLATSKPTTQRQWTNDTYENNHENIRCIMAYIVDLTVILNGLFISSHNVSATEVQSAIKDYAQTSARSQIHNEIRSFVRETPFTYQERDTIMAKIVDLITQNCVPTIK